MTTDSGDKYVDIGLIEEGVLNYSALPPELNGWRYHRIEYGGHAQSCFMERPIMLPPCSDAYILELLFEFWQVEGKDKQDTYKEIINELMRGMK